MGTGLGHEGGGGGVYSRGHTRSCMVNLYYAAVLLYRSLLVVRDRNVWFFLGKDKLDG